MFDTKQGSSITTVTALPQKTFMQTTNMMKQRLLKYLGEEVTYEEELLVTSSAAHVLPIVVMATPAMLTKTATILVTFKESWPKNAPMNRVNSPEVEESTVVLATLVCASAAFDKY